MKAFIFSFSLLISSTIFSQNKKILAPLLWEEIPIHIHNKINSQAFRSHSKSNNQGIFRLFKSNKGQYTIITIFHPKNESLEQIIWSLEKENQAQSVLTTHRTANFQTGKYLNYGDSPNFKNQAQIQTYLVNNRNSQYDQIRIGAKSPYPELPIENFTGIIPEILVFDKVLSFEEIREVESYLAIKYGISLDQISPTDYLNSEGTVIWDAKLNKDYPFNITGIGRDDYFGLYQKQSTSINQPYLLSIGIDEIYETNQQNPSQIPNLNYLIWSDNDGSLEFKSDVLNLTQILERKWVMNTISSDENVNTSLSLDLDQIEEEINFEHAYWLKVDKSGSGTFALENTHLFPSEIKENKALFQNINWTQLNVNKTAFTFTSGPPLLPLVEVTQPQCTPNTSGGIKLKVFGGKAPYQITIQNEQNTTQKVGVGTHQIIEFDNLTSGDYQLAIIDVDGKRVEQKFYLQSQDAPILDLKDTYYLSDNQPLQLDGNQMAVSGNNNLSFQWSGDNELKAYSPQIELIEAGNYQVEVAEGACISKYKFQVKALEEQVFERIEVYPNPISEGTTFKAKIKLKEVSSLKITITDTNGRIIKERNYPAQDYFLYSDQIEVQGNYFLTFATKTQKTTRSIIIH